LKFIHFTSPLVTQQKGIKAFIKKMIGREVRGYKDNLIRQKYNELIRNSYKNIFDLAEIESTLPDGTRTIHSIDGESYYSLYSGYTDDGGHLNKEAAKIVANKLLIFISELNRETI
jgi:lysophospholipase L1-like esterase